VTVPVVARIGLGVLLTAGVINLAACRPGNARDPQPSADASPTDLLRKGNAAGGRTFRMQLARAAERATKRAAGRNSIMFDEETVLEDLGSTMRGRVGYRGQVHADRDDFDGTRVEGEQRHYFHPQGAVIVDAVCAPKVSDCSGRTGLLDATETAVLQHLDTPGVDPLLPEGGRCEVPEGSTAAALMSCELAGGLVLTVQRLTLAETRQVLEKAAAYASASAAGQR
jgi:hypothetical protein